MCALTIYTRWTYFFGTNYSSLIDVNLNQIAKNWMGFFKLHFKHPLKDELTLLRGERIFVMELEGREVVIGKVEMGFELVTKARNLWIHIKCDILHESYYGGQQFEFLTLTKPKIIDGLRISCSSHQGNKRLDIIVWTGAQTRMPTTRLIYALAQP